MTIIMRESEFGGCQCAAGKDRCDCGLMDNAALAQEVNDEYDALHFIGHRVVEWACAIGVITLVYLIAFRGF